MADNITPELRLDDGTGTGVSIDTQTQESPIKEHGNAKIEFEKGNYDKVFGSIQEYSTKVNSIRQTVLPLVEKALIELFQYSTAYERVVCNINPVFTDAKISFNINAQYNAESWIDQDADINDVKHDQDYIIKTLSVVPGINIASVEIDTNTGNLMVNLTI